ncbi:hypothetical protein JAAARDRAFT_640415 [Jaapia argillacea MUCL 33604]|uniref:Uncharacterized protein n=1 Tax=Jaapia argillacea MUCL 33604 TaxID=933084 RepID=A0A067P3Q6_9AGAM|nr:hypothetical protein JAAARDRAFT_640415 [Jaapia argillacea MUCL 33604]
MGRRFQGFMTSTEVLKRVLPKSSRVNQRVKPPTLSPANQSIRVLPIYNFLSRPSNGHILNHWVEPLALSLANQSMRYVSQLLCADLPCTYAPITLRPF